MYIKSPITVVNFVNLLICAACIVYLLADFTLKAINVLYVVQFLFILQMYLTFDKLIDSSTRCQIDLSEK